MQKRITALTPGLLTGIVLSVLLHAGLFRVNALQSKPAEVIIDSGMIAVELTLVPSIASAPSVIEPEPVVDPEPEPKEKTAPIIPLPIPVIDEPSIIQPEIKQSEPTPPEPQIEPKQEIPEPAVESIDQDGSLEADKGAITEAQAKNTCHAAYPPLSRRRGEEGSVELSFDISKSGNISNIQIIQSSGHKRLDKAAIQAISGARFNPAEQFGKPIDSTLSQTFTFRLSK